MKHYGNVVHMLHQAHDALWTLERQLAHEQNFEPGKLFHLELQNLRSAAIAVETFLKNLPEPAPPVKISLVCGYGNFWSDHDRQAKVKQLHKKMEAIQQELNEL